jgi:hypothetical protein
LLLEAGEAVLALKPQASDTIESVNEPAQRRGASLSGACSLAAHRPFVAASSIAPNVLGQWAGNHSKDAESKSRVTIRKKSTETAIPTVGKQASDAREIQTKHNHLHINDDVL